MGLADAGAILTARIAAHEGDGLTRLETVAGPIWLPQLAGAVGQRVRIRVAAQDVMLATDRPEGLSALNILPVRVSAVQEGRGPGALVQLDLGGESLLARITLRSLRKRWEFSPACPFCSHQVGRGCPRGCRHRDRSPRVDVNQINEGESLASSVQGGKSLRKSAGRQLCGTVHLRTLPR
jgi:hypothetical protein